MEAPVKVYIAGAKGNMGRRYSAILRHLGHEVSGFDLPHFQGFGDDMAADIASEAEQSDAVIIATPTDTHARLLTFFRQCERPILCEKPISKNMKEVERLLVQLQRSDFQMVSQYDYLIDDVDEGPTVYDYFRSGTDGIYWDCINVIKHAKGYVRVANDSPVWKCQINGQKLNLGLMDQAYVEMIRDWLANPRRTDVDGIWKAHKKVHDLEVKCRAS
jgi:hypothetical protein